MKTVAEYKEMSANQLEYEIICLRESCKHSIELGNYGQLVKFATMLEYVDYLLTAKFAKVCNG